MKIVTLERTSSQAKKNLYYIVGAQPDEFCPHLLNKCCPHVDLIFLAKTSGLTFVDWNHLLKGDAGDLFPFIFHSKYLKLAGIKPESLPAQGFKEIVLFHVIEAGAKHYSVNWIKPEKLESVKLPDNLKKLHQLTEFFFFDYSKKFGRGAIFPDRCSYRALFWNYKNNGTYLHKVYRYPWSQPQHKDMYSPAFDHKLIHSVNYYDFGQILGPDGNSFFWLEMDRLNGENAANWVLTNLSCKSERHWISKAFIELWIEFSDYGCLPLDLSLSNAIITPDKRLKIIDLEEAVAFESVFVIGDKRPLHCLLSLITYLDTNIWSKKDRKTLRFDTFRDTCYIPRWSCKNGLWHFNVEAASQKDELFIELAEGAMNSRNINELNNKLDQVYEQIVIPV